MRVDWNTRVPMRDGTLLSADVFRSGNGEPRTTLVARTPYNKNNAESQARAAKAQANGYFDRSVVPVKDVNGLVVLDRDEFIRPGTTVESLSGLKPSFQFHGDIRKLLVLDSSISIGKLGHPFPSK